MTIDGKSSLFFNGWELELPVRIPYLMDVGFDALA